ncbi:PilZ domain-containing protein [bacterium]|nr:MAG: PilZ domain-containing protein [bacterium]
MMEKRKYARVPDGARVVYKVMGVKGEHLTPALDMGSGGLRLPLQEKVKPGTLLELNISLPDDKEPFFGLVKAVWQSPAATQDKDGLSYYETGIEFIKVGLENRRRIVKYVTDYAKKNNL